MSLSPANQVYNLVSSECAVTKSKSICRWNKYNVFTVVIVILAKIITMIIIAMNIM